jgi:hypothetical protein
MRTLLLDTEVWDFVIDVAGNWAVARNPYALAQDAASAIRLFQGELWYNTVPGVPYWSQILGFAPPVALMKAKFVEAALTVPEVKSAQAFISKIEGRVVTGQVQTTDSTTGQTSAVNF